MRQIAGELEISPAYLSYIVNGKRPWRKDLYRRYMGVVNSFVNSEEAIITQEASAISRSGTLFGAGDEIRTHDFLLGKQTLYH